jgi:hypothetical protein
MKAKTTEATIPLPQLAARLMQDYGRSPSYIRLHRAVVSGQVPGVERAIAGWHVPVAALPVIADLFQLAE